VTIHLPHDIRAYTDALFDTIREPILILNSASQVITANRSFYQTFQFVPAEVEDKTLYDLRSGEWDIPSLRRLLVEGLPAAERIEDFELTHTFSSIGQRTLLLNARLLPRSESAEQHILLAMEDVTRRVQGEARLRQSEDRFRAISEMTSDYAYAAILYADGTLHIEWISGALQRITGFTAEEFIRLGVDTLIHPADREIWDRRIDALSAEKPAEDEFRIVTKSGRIRWLVDTARPVAVSERGIQIVGAAQDITERKEALETLRQRNEEMEQFVYTVSHDLKSPLVTITGFIGMLESHLAAGRIEKVHHSIGRIQRSADRMSQLIDELLDLSRIGRVTGEPTPVDVTRLVRQLGETMQQRLETVGGKLVVEPDMPHIWADEKRLSEVFENLLSNAIKYGCNEPGKQITVSATLTASEVRYTIEDEGPGIDPNYHEKIFGLFQRLDSTSEGTGVGLTIVAKIMRVHGGRIWVESELGAGARFVLAFPRSLLVNVEKSQI
jgi:PAS domain S-box-containing protein